ncbi:MAG: TonB-dependent receptor plug domain-containing protein [Bacteroidetes bacterium]|nr:TonB-dependent receptor plug domain-containing protein [Bacteroidota bacterium]
MKQFFTILTLLYSAVTVQAQGLVIGHVQSNDGRNLTGAKIYALGQPDTVWSDMEGRYKLTLPAGRQIIYTDAKSYQPQTDSVEVNSGKETYISSVLSPISTMKTAEVFKARKAKTNSIAGSIQAKQLSVNMVEQVGAEELKNTTVRTTSDAIKRIPGATIMDGKFANIRGMFDRYNAGYLNGAPLPSTESDRKAFSFDIIPASLLDNIMVIKSATPDLIGDFGGGIIRINTKSIPEKLTQNLNFGMQYNSITTFRDIQGFGSQTTELFGIPGSQRQIPNLDGTLTAANPEHSATETKKFNNDWSLRNIKSLPAPRFSYSIGVPFKLGKDRELGLLLSLNYAITQKYSDGLINSNDLSDNHLRSSYSDRLFSSNVQNGGIANLSLKLNKSNRIDWKNLFTLTYDAGSTLRKGTADYDNQVTTDGYSNMVNFNRLISTQLNGTHILGKNQETLTWLVNAGNTYRQIPDFRIAQYTTLEGTERFLTLNEFFNASSGRFFSDMKENTLSASVDYLKSVKTGMLVSNFKVGLFAQERFRSFTSRQFTYGPTKPILSSQLPEQDLSDAGMKASGIYLIERTGKDKDEYQGSSHLRAAYAMAEHHYPLFFVKGKPQNLKVIYGVRMESFEQKLTNDFFKKIGKPMAQPARNNDWLPSVNIIAPITSKIGLRGSYYKTLNRPEMRELAPFAFYNFNLNSEILGNPNLKRAELHNWDMRFEVFPGKEDMVSVGLFAKRIINPIEFALDASQALIRTFTYQNASRAEVTGFEAELRKNLGFISRAGLPKFFNHLSLYSNVAIIRSKVQFKANTGVENRPLQGQSPYVANVSLYYNNPDNGIICNVNFNKIGSRIAYIGVPKSVQPFGSDIYEYGRSILDLQIGKNFGKNKMQNLRITFGDLLAQRTVFYQDLDANKKYTEKGDNTLFRYTNGRTVTLSYGYTF